MNDCLFCNIVAGEIPSTKVYDNDHIVAFLDINPVNPGHTLIVTKKHFADMRDTPDEVLAHVAVATKKIAQAVCEGLGYPAYNIEVNTGKEAGQIIMHTHWHVVPRLSTDGLRHWPGKKYADGQAQAVAEKIIKALS